MDSKKYIGMDVHKEAISIAVLSGSGKLVMESIIATKAITIVEFMQELRGELQVTLRKGPVDLAVRPAEAACSEDRSVRSAQECLAEGREQE